MANMFDYRLEHIFSFSGTLKTEVIGPLPEGIRVNFYVTGGEVEGPMVKGQVLPVGGDWLTIRSDGIGILDVRATFQTHDGALIYATYSGVADLGADGYQKFLQQDLPPFIPLRIVPTLSHGSSSLRLVESDSVLGDWTGRHGTFGSQVRHIRGTLAETRRLTGAAPVGATRDLPTSIQS